MSDFLFNIVVFLTPATLSKKRLAQVFSCWFCKIFKNTFSYKSPPVAASASYRSSCRSVPWEITTLKFKGRFPGNLPEVFSAVFLGNPMKRCYLQKHSPRDVLTKKFLKICSKFTGEHSRYCVISIKLQSNFIQITLRHGCSPVNLLHVFRTLFTKNTSRWLLLYLGPCLCSL